MAHEHHHCSCKHERLRFCEKCRVPHCLDCGKEWVEKVAYQQHWWPYTTTGGSIGNSGTATISAGTISALTDNTTLLKACEH